MKSASLLGSALFVVCTMFAIEPAAAQSSSVGTSFLKAEQSFNLAAVKERKGKRKRHLRKKRGGMEKKRRGCGAEHRKRLHRGEKIQTNPDIASDAPSVSQTEMSIQPNLDH